MSSPAVPDSSPSTTALHMCPLCEAGCGLSVQLVDGEPSLIRGDRDDVFSHGFLCPKGTALKALQNDPDRLRRPLIKRDGAFVEVDFVEAFAEVDRLFKPVVSEHGPLSCGLVIGNPTVHRTGLVLYALDLAAAIGSPNVFSAASLDQMPKHLSVGRMFGDFYSIPVPDIERTDLLVIIGANPMVSNGSMWSVPDFRGKAKALRARGGRIVTVDPRFTETSKVADHHHHIRPGTDAMFLAAIVRVLFDEGLADPGLVAEHLVGVDAVRKAVEPFDLDEVSRRCGVAAADMRSLARQLASARAAAVYGRLGTCLQQHATVTSWLIDVINILTGNLDQPGGAMFAKPPAFAANTAGPPGRGEGVSTGSYSSRVSGAPEVMNQFPIACLAEEIETPGQGQIHGLVMIASNVALSSPDGPRVERALAKLDALVCLDPYLNETTRHADVIIPGPSALEEAHFDVFFANFAHRNVARYSPPAIPKPPGVPDDWETMVRLIGIFSEMGPKVDVVALDDDLTRRSIESSAPGQGGDIMEALAPRVGADRRIDLGLRTGPYGDLLGLNPDGLCLDKVMAKPSGVDLGPLESRLPEILRTPSGKVELAPADFVDALSGVVDDISREQPECVLIGRRHLRSNNSWMHNLPILMKGKARCTLLVHPNDANSWKLVDGGVAKVTALSTDAAIAVTVEFDDAMMPGVVSLPHGWGHDGNDTKASVASQNPGVNFNVLADPNRRDALSGNAALNGISVTVRMVRRPSDE
ncbi:MAG: molybdopterin-dependent oxidoreductase [Actinobacteria bacterium]|nr:molybdopterin-dependent oxidoreductase [Actinomycetota bacterium]